jgi:hypothetical protein
VYLRADTIEPAFAIVTFEGAFADAYQFGGLLDRTLGTAAYNLFSNSVESRREAASSFNANASSHTASRPAGRGAEAVYCRNDL